MKLGYRVKETKARMFSAVLTEMDKKTERAFNHFGGYVRKVARNSMKKAGKKKTVSDPGSPPLVHTGAIKNRVVYAYDANTRSVVIGPTPFPSKLGNPGARDLEEGSGNVVVKTRNGKTVIYKFRKRPFMKPAFDKGLPTAAAGFAN